MKYRSSLRNNKMAKARRKGRIIVITKDRKKIKQWSYIELKNIK